MNSCVIITIAIYARENVKVWVCVVPIYVAPNIYLLNNG